MHSLHVLSNTCKKRVDILRLLLLLIVKLCCTIRNHESQSIPRLDHRDLCWTLSLLEICSSKKWGSGWQSIKAGKLCITSSLTRKLQFLSNSIISALGIGALWRVLSTWHSALCNSAAHRSTKRHSGSGAHSSPSSGASRNTLWHLESALTA